MDPSFEYHGILNKDFDSDEDPDDDYEFFIAPTTTEDDAYLPIGDLEDLSMETMMQTSPASSPRLPSPPPMAEDQTKPVSPRPGASHVSPSASSRPSDAAAARRIRSGTRSADIAEGPPLVDIGSIDSAFQHAEHLKALYNSYIRPEGSKNVHPLTHEQCEILATPPDGVDKQLWLYELCRFLVMKLNDVVNSLFRDHPPCSSETCPEMRASEWQYLCAVHQPPKACCAIDYCCHTLDWAGNQLTNPKEFPSRLSMGGENTASGNSQMKTMTNIMRRVYRIFAHAWFSHRSMFWSVENKWGTYRFFKTVADAYALIPEDNCTVPPEAEGKELPQSSEPSRSTASTSAPPSILKRPESQRPVEAAEPSGGTSSNLAAPGATARRHRHTPSKGQPVDTVLEEQEEEEELDLASSPPPPPSRRDTQLFIDPTTTPEPLSSSGTTNSPPSSSPSVTSAGATGSGSEACEPPSAPKPFSPYSSFSPASPKAATFEEVRDKGKGKEEVTKSEGAEAGDTASAEGDDATKSVED